MSPLLEFISPVLKLISHLLVSSAVISFIPPVKRIYPYILFSSTYSSILHYRGSYGNLKVLALMSPLLEIMSPLLFSREKGSFW